MPCIRRLAHSDSDDALLPERPRRYGGHPSPLADDAAIEWVQEQIRAGRSSRSIAEEIGYCHVPSFSSAFLARTGERPTEYRDRVGAPIARREGGVGPSIQPRAIKDRTDHSPYPRYDAKKKPKKRRKKRRAAKKQRS